jgi:hypothetical protein
LSAWAACCRDGLTGLPAWAACCRDGLDGDEHVARLGIRVLAGTAAMAPSRAAVPYCAGVTLESEGEAEQDRRRVENTQATSLSWPRDVRRGFDAELRQRLDGRAEVGLTLEASVTMARVLGAVAGG